VKLRALVRDRASIQRFLRHQNLWIEPLDLAEARPPPYFRGTTRLKPTRQAELFEVHSPFNGDISGARTPSSILSDRRRGGRATRAG
jgi:hypothetical protein